MRGRFKFVCIVISDVGASYVSNSMKTVNSRYNTLPSFYVIVLPGIP